MIMPLPFVFDPTVPSPGICLDGLGFLLTPLVSLPKWSGLPPAGREMPVTPRAIECVDDPDDDEDVGDEEDLSVAQPLADEESSFDDFDDEFDDDFEEEENDPDWDHPDDGDEAPPPGKGTGKKK